MKKQTEKSQKNGETEPTAPSFVVLRFFCNNPGYFFSVTQIRDQIHAQTGYYIKAATIRKAIKNIRASGINIVSSTHRAGAKCIPIKFYTFKK